ncbi:hypothetical protein QE152_g26707 [Popillia japonica]|uniref:Integrase catalytic domain-containing protein n=1 Tax=Popillia japonica TaxID=7064 RepID=A0AAW1JWA0_POPJA
MNGAAERANRTIIEKARSMLQEASLEPAYWAEAVNRAVYLKNRSPTKALSGMLPEEYWTEDNKPHNRDTGSSNFEEKQSCELVIEFLLKQDKIENDKTSNESNPTDDEFSPEIDSSDDESGQSTSAEKAISEAGKEVIYAKRLISELYGDVGTVVLHSDNQGAGKLTENPVYHNRTKHIDVKYHFIRELHEKKELIVEYCPTENMVADLLTKGLPKSKHLFCVGLKAYG